MNKILFSFLFLLFILVSCENSGGLGYQIEDNTVIYRSWNEGHGFTIKTLNADSNSFVDIDGTWAKDHSNVFYLGKSIPKLSGKSFIAMDRKFGKDDNNVYCAYTFLDLADASTFKIYKGNNSDFQSYGKDKNAAYFCVEHIEGYSRILSKSIESFRSLGSGYKGDNENIYWLSHKLKGVIPSAFKVLSGNYGTDGKSVFYKDYLIAGADVNTFEVLDVVYAKAKDKNYFYNFEDRGKRVENE